MRFKISQVIEIVVCVCGQSDFSKMKDREKDATLDGIVFRYVNLNVSCMRSSLLRTRHLRVRLLRTRHLRVRLLRTRHLRVRLLRIRHNI